MACPFPEESVDVETQILHKYSYAYMKGKRRYFHVVWPLIYTKTQILSQKTIILKTQAIDSSYILIYKITEVDVHKPLCN